MNALITPQCEPSFSSRIKAAEQMIPLLQRQVREAGLPVPQRPLLKKSLRIMAEGTEAEVARLQGLLRGRQVQVAAAKASAERTAAAIAAANTPAALWDQYRQLDPAAKNAFYALHKKIMDR